MWTNGRNMSEKIAVELGDVQRTMLLPLWGRAVESQKAQPLLVWTKPRTRLCKRWIMTLGRLHVRETLFYFGRRTRRLNLKNRRYGALSDFLKVHYMVHLDLLN